MASKQAAMLPAAPSASSSADELVFSSDSEDDRELAEATPTFATKRALEPEQEVANGDALGRTISLSVDEYAGEEEEQAFHGTDSRSAQLIVRSQRFRPSSTGMLGVGVIT